MEPAKFLEQLRGIAEQPDGIIHARPNSPGTVGIQKCGSWLELLFLDAFAEVESRLDLRDPSLLVDVYTQLMMLGLLWQREPAKVHVIGLGGGIIPMTFHRHFPNTTIECTEIDKEVVEVAKAYFGVITDLRLQVLIGDGREHLEKRHSRGRYDIIFVDAFEGVGCSPFALGTVEFYEVCHNRLAENGIVVVNLMAADFLYYDKIKTMIASFDNVHFVAAPGRTETSADGRSYVIPGGQVFFGTSGESLGGAALTRRAKSIEDTREFAFPLAAHAAKLTPISEVRAYRKPLATAKVLSDSFPPPPPAPLQGGIAEIVDLLDRLHVLTDSVASPALPLGDIRSKNLKRD